MTQEDPDLARLCARLHAERHLPDDWRDRLAAAEAARLGHAPWYVRAMVGFGAWLASLFFVGFVVGINMLTADSAFVITGILLMLAAVGLRRTLDGDFPNQAALAASLAGQVLLMFGLVQITSGAEPPLLALIAVNGILIPLYPDGLHRVLSVLAIVGAFVALLYLKAMQDFLPFTAPGLTLGLLLLVMREGHWLGGRRRALLGALSYGLLFAAFGCVLLSTIYLLPELAEEFSFYPRPWISTLAFGALLLAAVRHYLAPNLAAASHLAMPLIYGIVLALTAASLWAPGITFSLLIVFLGSARDDRVMSGTGLGFFVVFLAAYFYGIETTLLMKSATLAATGIVLLTARFAVLRFLDAAEGGNHA